MSEIPDEKSDEIFTVGPDLVDVTEKFLLQAKKNNCQVIIVISPSYKKVPLDFINYAKSLGLKYDVDVINHFKDSTFLNHPNYFHDSDHLNNSGATIFSEQIAKELKLNMSKLN